MRDVAGSPYSIQDYSPAPYLATWDQLDEARRKLLARGMGLVLDFVPNHTGWDHPWIQSHPEYYVLGTQADFRMNPSAYYLVERPAASPPESPEGLGPSIFIARAKDPYFPPWQDLAQLNYFQPITREAMIGELRKIARHCDGVRCDMAMLVLNEIFGRTWGQRVSQFPVPEREFWTEAIAALPGFVWIAEVYWDLEPRLQQLGFNFTYDKGLYDRLRDDRVSKIHQRLQAGPDDQQKLVRFLENHDEERSLV
jgi:glycosidase